MAFLGRMGGGGNSSTTTDADGKFRFDGKKLVGVAPLRLLATADRATPLEQVINAENAPRIEASVVCEGANGPTTAAADEILAEKRIFVIPDILANAGGVTGTTDWGIGGAGGGGSRRRYRCRAGEPRPGPAGRTQGRGPWTDVQRCCPASRH